MAEPTEADTERTAKAKARDESRQRFSRGRNIDSKSGGKTNWAH